jgi:hypothetical protein
MDQISNLAGHKRTNFFPCFLQDVVEYYNSGTEDGYKKFVPSKKKKRDGEFFIFLYID